ELGPGLPVANPYGSTNDYRLDATGSRSLISVDYQGYARLGTSPSMSADGRFVAFQTIDSLSSFQSWPVVSDTNGATDIVLRDFGDPWQPCGYATDKSLAVSLNRFGRSSGDRSSWRPLISPDGKWVVFYSLASDLATNVIDLNSTVAHLFVRNLGTSTTKLVDRDTNGVPVSGGATNPVFSLASHSVFFQGA